MGISSQRNTTRSLPELYVSCKSASVRVRTSFHGANIRSDNLTFKNLSISASSILPSKAFIRLNICFFRLCRFSASRNTCVANSFAVRSPSKSRFDTCQPSRGADCILLRIIVLPIRLKSFMYIFRPDNTSHISAISESRPIISSASSWPPGFGFI